MEKSEQSELSVEEGDSHREDFQEVLRNLPKERELITGNTYYSYQGFWVPDDFLKNIVSFQKHFVALDGDLLLASCPKSGTTWLKSLAFSIVNRHNFTLSNSPLLTNNPHDLVPFLEIDVYGKPESIDPNNSINNIPQPRLLFTHVPYPSLPISIKNSNCKIVYIYRDTMDQFVSSWHFLYNAFQTKKEHEECFDQFCRGIHIFGPFWDHVLGFWKASLERPQKVLFIKYEDLKSDVLSQVKQLAEFLGFPFSDEEEKQGLIEQIAKLCSIENMKSLKCNMDGRRSFGAPHSSFFRKGVVGDWKNHLTPSMVERMKKIMQEKFEESGLQIS